jgi:type IV pilus assembly protein PilY1
MDFDSGTASPAIGAERIISQALLRRRTLFFNTITPDATPCNSGGTGWLMSLDFLTGLNPTIPTFDANNDGKIDSSDLLFIGQLVSQGVIARSGILGNQQYTPTSAGDLLRREVNVGESSLEGRLGWEEVLPD